MIPPSFEPPAARTTTTSFMCTSFHPRTGDPTIHNQNRNKATNTQGKTNPKKLVLPTDVFFNNKSQKLYNIYPSTDSLCIHES